MTIKTSLRSVKKILFILPISFLFFSFSIVRAGDTIEKREIFIPNTKLYQTTVLLKNKLTPEEVENVLIDLAKNKLFARVYFETNSSSFIFYNSEDEAKLIVHEIENYFKNKNYQIENILSKVMPEAR